MKNIIVLACMLGFITAQAQVKPKYEKEGALVKATYFYEDGKIKEQGFFKNKKLEGTWVSFNKEGKKTAIAHYKKGKKIGKWFIWHKDELKEIDYNDYTVTNVQVWKEKTNTSYTLNLPQIK